MNKLNLVNIALVMLAPEALQGHVDAVVENHRHDAGEVPPATRGHMSIAIDPTGIDRFTRSVRVIASTPDPVPGQKAIKTWKLDRFLKNPVVLWAHDSTIMPIGVASEVDPENPAGLSMRIRFASSKVSQLAEETWNGVLEEIVKAVSVGFDMTGESEAELVELSVTPIGLDEDAGTPALNPAAGIEPTDEQRAEMLKNAAATMARHLHRMRVKKRTTIAAAALGDGAEGRSLKTDGMRFDLTQDEVLRMDVSPLRLDGLKDTPTGGKVIKARLTRVGVLMYRDPSMPDGWRRELRLPEDVFNRDSLATLKGATLIDIKDHSGMVTPDTWKRAAHGVVMDVREDGDYVDSEVHVNDRVALDAIEKGDRRDVSCGYKCRLEWKSGEWRGQKYDCIQRGHVYNHVALCPPNGGRAGTDVGVRADGNINSNLPQWGVSHWDSEDQNMTIKIRLDGREMEEFSKEHFDTIERMHKAEISKLSQEHAEVLTGAKKGLVEKLDAMKAERDGAVQSLETFKADLKAQEKDAEEKKAKEEAAHKTERTARRQLERHAFRLLSRIKPDDEEEDSESEDDGDEKKPAFLKKGKRAATAKLDSFLDTATDRQIHERVIKALPGGDKFDCADQSDLYVKVRYDMLLSSVGDTLGNGIADVVASVKEHQERADNFDAADSPLGVMTAARKARDAAAFAAGKPPPFNGTAK